MVSALKTWCAVAGAIVGLAWGGCLASAAPPRAAEVPREGGVRVTVNKPVMNERQNHDHLVADWLLIGNNEEVEMAKLAQTHAEHKQVREFAEHMQRIHSDVMMQLEQFSRQNARSESAGQSAAPVTSGLSPAQTRHAASMHGGFNFLEVQRQIAAQCLATASKEMGAKKGIEFDRAYVGSQIGAHYKLIDTQKVLREYASPELQKEIDKGIEIAESHVDQATKIMHELEGRERGEK